jgi:Flp pilus assembly pilin Flp
MEESIMGYALMAWLHVAGLDLMQRMRDDRRGQGTVEYVGVVVMVTLLIGAVAVAAKGWAPAVGDGLKKAIQEAIKSASGGL